MFMTSRKVRQRMTKCQSQSAAPAWNAKATFFTKLLRLAAVSSEFVFVADVATSLVLSAGGVVDAPVETGKFVDEDAVDASSDVVDDVAEVVEVCGAPVID